MHMPINKKPKRWLRNEPLRVFCTHLLLLVAVAFVMNELGLREYGAIGLVLTFPLCLLAIWITSHWNLGAGDHAYAIGGIWLATILRERMPE